MKRNRVYGEIKEMYVDGKGWMSYTNKEKAVMYSIEYKEIDEQGNITAEGQEDFSVKRLQESGLKTYYTTERLLEKRKTQKAIAREINELGTFKTTCRKTLVKYLERIIKEDYVLSIVKWY